MKILFSLAALLLTLAATAQQRLQKLWESDTTLAIPESVLPHPTKNLLYVSLIDGGAWEKDGKGGIALMDTSGKILNATWTTGLHAPKGMALVGNNLYVADVTDVVVVDATTGKVKNRIAVDSALMLNDVTANAGGDVFVSDSRTGKVHHIAGNKAMLYLQGMQGVNGLRVHNNQLYVATGKQLLKSGTAGATSVVTDTQMGGDGIEPTADGGWLLSSWSGTIYYIDTAGKSTLLLDTREQKKNAADIGYNPATRVVYVPTFLGKSVVAYRFH
jgi:DNA-binding beta-propeller fold protein YncE